MTQAEGSDKDMDNLSLLTSERSSNPNSTIKRNQSYDSDIVSDKDMANQSSFTQKRPSTPNRRTM